MKSKAWAANFRIKLADCSNIWELSVGRALELQKGRSNLASTTP
jgi:hypothetical protein